jgi:uncharacterized protein YdeI (YjbR/CyaY-like superfamily)
MDTFKDLPIMAFDAAARWRDWLDGHHGRSTGIWLRIYKKGSAHPTVTYAEALDEALCYGWIDSVKYSYDSESFLQRFGPRKAKSIWSKINREHVARLIAEGRMQPAGLQAVEAAKADGRWAAAYDSFSRSTVPDDFQAALDAHPDAKAFFEGLNKTNRYAFCMRIQSAKKVETRTRRIAWAIDKLLRQEKIH